MEKTNAGEWREEETGETDGVCATQKQMALPVLEIDYAKYEQLLDDPDLTEKQKRAFIETIWNTIVTFVDAGFGVHPVQQAQNPCGKLTKNLPKPAVRAPDGVELSDAILLNKFEGAAVDKTDKAAEGIDS